MGKCDKYFVLEKIVANFLLAFMKLLSHVFFQCEYMKRKFNIEKMERKKFYIKVLELIGKLLIAIFFMYYIRISRLYNLIF